MKIFFPILILIIISFSYCSLLFTIKNTEPHCLGRDFYENSILIFKYKIFTKSKKDLSSIFPNLKLYIQEAKANKIINYYYFDINKGKITFRTPKEGLYEMCIKAKQYSVISDLKEDLFVNFKITTNYFYDEDILSNALNIQDVDSVNQKAKQILKATVPLIESQKKEFEVENELSLNTLSYANFYKRLTYIQLIITFIIGIVQIYNFKRFLKSQNVI